MRLVVLDDAEAVAAAAADLVRQRLAIRPELIMAVPAGRTPRRMYARLRALQAEAPVDFSRMRVFAIDELCPPGRPDGYFWSQVRREFLSWAPVTAGNCRPFQVGAPDLEAMCQEYEATIAALGGLDLVLCGLGPNAHLASNEPGTPFDSLTRPVRLLPESVAYMLTDQVNREASPGPLSDRAVTLGLGTISRAREVVLLVCGAGKRQALRRALDGPVGPDVPASVLRAHPACLVLADREAAGRNPDI